MNDLPKFGYIPISHVAKYFGVCEVTIRRWVARKEFPHPEYFSDGATRFDAKEVWIWIEKRKAERDERKARSDLKFKQMVETRKRNAREKKNQAV
ncbi:helix-turn-helix domain-containing protein [Salmonella enterica]|nr:helix-turn-helix domain-containing protein [Salmonella enterica]